MKALRDFLDKIKPNFEKGGRFEKLHSVFDGFETFLFVPNTVTKKGSHIRDAIDMKRTMATVVLAMIPALLFGIWNVGYQHFEAAGSNPEFWTIVGYGLIKVLPIVVVSYVTGLAIEFFFAQIRGHEINEGFLVTGMLIPLVLPPTIPLWMVALATAFAVIIGKEVFGGTGMNILNPALTARAFLFFAYPAFMSGDRVWIAEKADTFSGATPLANAANGELAANPDFFDMFFGFIPGSIGETSTALIIVGAIILLFTGVGSWRIMLSAVAGGLIMGLLFNLWGANEFMTIPAHHQLVMGGFAFGVVFMATDPVSGSQTNKGKYIYGFLIGFLAILIRVFNPAYPEGIMLAILFMNVMAPLIDYYIIQANIKHRAKRAKLKTT
ncbi:MAG: NADH:ubiquinone reductase (Na(+)-transporting) subunit B [Bacteroidales bacterium]|nr:NADH:ubiquinone reductase (Na(+)-transporting) subunit B [Bacteroidales bacterium]MCF8327198.1 NADH:ubiquinone reductase (Na(+)-transporting) subunit B [Bacteroidales bacterium]MCF8339250.1 NADH:ubiquinone reductase (Na(+)-transporting) subunit B [Bacteroidales bacterium]